MHLTCSEPYCRWCSLSGSLLKKNIIKAHLGLRHIRHISLLSLGATMVVVVVFESVKMGESVNNSF